MEMKDRISQIIEKRNISRSKFASELKISPASVTQMCSGRINPSSQTIELICQKFRINEKWLRTGEGEMEISDPLRAKLENFFADVLATCPDERSDLVAALADLPPEFWKMAAQYTRNCVDNLKKED